MFANKPTLQLLTFLTIWVSLVLLSSPLVAAEASEPRLSKSISFSVNDNLDKNTKDIRLKQSTYDVIAPLDTTRARLESSISASHLGSAGNGDIYVYDASSDLISDINYDGYYHRFSIAIDVDTAHEVSYVYADLYLSFEGGPWDHYATSDNYHIYGDSEADIFVIESELADGFPSGYYDIKIVIYNADSGEWLSNYGPYEDSSLAALPLQDSYDDDFSDGNSFPVETGIIIGAHAGAVNWWLLTLPVLTLAFRRFK